MDTLVCVNGPVQNGDFTLADTPGKATSIRIAAALNAILGIAPVPHLWNTVTLAGDLRHRARIALGSRAIVEAAAIAAKYPPGAGLPEILTDTAAPVAALALEMITDHLSTGVLAITTVTVRVCVRCGHMTGTQDRPCRACGHPDTRPERARHLTADRANGEPVLADGDFYAPARPPAHLRQIAGNVPATLILSRTRDHGIDLAPIGLRGLVLDPRAGLHVNALAVGIDRQADTTVMITTEAAAANIAAYGMRFRRHHDHRLRYALHGRLPYDHLVDLAGAYTAGHLQEAARDLFENWYLPLAAFKAKRGVPAGQLPALFTHFQRCYRARPPHADAELLAVLRRGVRAGDTNWIADKTLLATAMTTCPPIALSVTPPPVTTQW
jgi:ribosomal protein L37E